MTSEVEKTRASDASTSSGASTASAESRIRAAAINNPPHILQSLDCQAREEALSQCAVRHYAEGESIIREGECGDGLCFIASGRAEVTLLSRSGAQVRWAELEQGDNFGESSLIDNRPHSTTVTALTDVQMFVMPPKVFRCMSARYPVVTVALLQQLLAAQRDMNKRMKAAKEDGRRKQDAPDARSTDCGDAGGGDNALA